MAVHPVKVSLFLTLMLFTAETVLAQTTGLQTGLGTGTSGLMGTSGLGGSSGLSSGFSSGLTTGGLGAAGAGGASTTAGAGNATQQFIGGNATQGFIGGARQATGQQTANRQFQAFQSAQTQSNTQSQQTGTPRQVRTVLRIGFQFPAATAAQQSGRLAPANTPGVSRFVSSYPELSAVDVTLNNEGVAILTGAVPSTESRRLAANLIRLQPGVRKVDNQIALVE